MRELGAGDFDVQATIEELAKAKAELEVEKNKTKGLNEELENVKRGSIAVIKFIKSQQGSEVDHSTLTDKLASEMANRETLELKIMQLEEVAATLKEKHEGKVAELPPDEQDIKKREIALSEKEAELEAMQKQLLAKEEALSKGVIAAAMQAGSGAVPASTVADQSEAWAAKEQEVMLVAMGGHMRGGNAKVREPKTRGCSARANARGFSISTGGAASSSPRQPA